MIGERIKILRERTGKSQEALAGDIGVHSNTIARWERGEMIPRGTSIAKIASALNVTPNDLMGKPNTSDDPARPQAPAGQPAPANNDVTITVPLTTSDGQPGRIVYEWGGDNRVELPDTPENRETLLRLIEKLAAAGHYLDSFEIEQDGQRYEYAKVSGGSPEPDGAISA